MGGRRREGHGHGDHSTPPMPSRRRFLGAITLPLLGKPAVETASGRVPCNDGSRSVGRSRRRVGNGDGVDGGFDPGVHGFGFQNWSTAVSTYPEHDHEDVTEEQVRRAIRSRWKEPLERALGVDVGRLSGALLDVVAKQLYVAVNQRSGTNGHCYGMVFVAQTYYENPASIPLDRESASEFTHPDEPVDDPGASPVGREIDLFQNAQFLDFYAWVGRRAVFRPGWIDYRTQLDDLCAVIDTFGTAGVTLVNTQSRTSHQVLLYGYRETPNGLSFSVYEPNRPADQYRTGRAAPTLDVDTSGENPVVEPYSSPSYDAFVYNRYDRVIAARRSAAPLDGIDRPNGALRDALSTVAVFLVDADVELTVVGPDGRQLSRTVSPFMDRRHTEYHRMRVRYGAPPGRYRVAVTGTVATEYTLEIQVASLDGGLLSTRTSASIAAGDVHEYTATVPESSESGGSIDRRDVSGSSTLTNVALAVGAAGFATGAYAVLRRYRSGRDVCPEGARDDEPGGGRSQ